MALLLISDKDVRRLLTMEECIAAMERAFHALAEGKAQQPLRTMIKLSGERGAFASKPAALDDPDCFGLKVITVWPANEGTKYDSHQGAVLLFEPEHGSPVALIDASSITAIRTAAVSALATRLLARTEVNSLAIIGSGVQAVTHLEAMLAVRRFTQIRVFSRNYEHARDFAHQQSARFYLNVEAVKDAREAVINADVICTVTSSREPVIAGDWLKPGVHINAVGASTAASRELGGNAVARSRYYADRRESSLNEAGEFLMAKAEGLVNDSHIVGELSELVAGRVPGRRSNDEITLFKSVGLAIEDLAAAHLIWQRAKADDQITSFELGGLRSS